MDCIGSMKIKSQLEKIIIYHIITYSIKTLISAPDSPHFTFAFVHFDHKC